MTKESKPVKKAAPKKKAVPAKTKIIKKKVVSKQRLILSETTVSVEASGVDNELQWHVADEFLSQQFLPPCDHIALPTGIRFLRYVPPRLIFVHEQPPHVRRLRWITPDSPAEYGDDTEYRYVQVSVPYTIKLGTLIQSRGTWQPKHDNEIYFRNDPLATIDDELFYPALLNVSVVRKDHTWCCTQYLKPPKADPHLWQSHVHEMVNHMWFGGFNYSSENHEGMSWFGRYKKDPDISPVENWESNTSKDPAFGIKHSWMKAPHTIRSLMEERLSEFVQETPHPRFVALHKAARSVK